jgi:hypothetical protein
MLYFDTLPKLLTPDQNGNPLLLTNILTRAKLLEELQNNPMLFYKYDIQDSDTPEIIASKYYGDPNRFWLITYSNQILDPVWDWPLPYQQFLQYIESKYAAEAAEAEEPPLEYTTNTIHAYQKIVNTTDNTTLQTTEKIVTIDYESYQSLIPSTNTYTLPNGETCTIAITKNVQTVYDYEYELNEAKRNIKILNENYAGQMEQTFVDVMNR